MTDIGLDTSTSAGLAAAVRDARLPDPDTRRSIRETAGVTIREAAAAIGVSPMALHRWERGDARPRRHNAIAYARLLDALRDAAS